MKRFVEGVDREQGTLFPLFLDDWINDDNPVRVPASLGWWCRLSASEFRLWVNIGPSAGLV